MELKILKEFIACCIFNQEVHVVFLDLKLLRMHPEMLLFGNEIITKLFVGLLCYANFSYELQETIDVSLSTK